MPETLDEAIERRIDEVRFAHPEAHPDAISVEAARGLADVEPADLPHDVDRDLRDAYWRAQNDVELAEEADRHRAEDGLDPGTHEVTSRIRVAGVDLDVVSRVVVRGEVDAEGVPVVWATGAQVRPAE